MGLLSRLLGRTAKQAWPDFGSFDDVTRLPVNATREIGAGALPVSPSQPFRNSLRGGSDDLMEAARPKGLLSRALSETPDAGRGGAGNDWATHLRTQGFDVETPLFHGTTKDFDTISSSTGAGHSLGPGIYFGSGERGSEVANFYARGGNPQVGREAAEGGVVRQYYARGRLADGEQYASAMDRALRKTRGDSYSAREIAIRDLEARGFTGIRDDSTGYVVVWRSENVAPRFGQAPQLPDGGA